MRDFFFKNNAENEAERLLPDLFLFFEKALYDVKAKALHLSFNIFDTLRFGYTIKTNCIKLSS